jgi:hypothetical protein
MGRICRAQWIVVVLALLIAPVQGWTACKLTRYAAVDLAYGPNGAVMVPVQIGSTDVWMALTMSTGLSMISPAAVKQLGLQVWRVDQDNLLADGMRIESQTSAKTLLIGGANFADWSLFVYPGAERPLQMFRGRPMVGNISAKFMNVVDVELDFANSRMNLFQQSTCGGESVYWSKQFTAVKLYSDASGLLLFPMELDGKKVETSLNTAGPRSRLSEAVARSHFRFDRKSPGLLPDQAGAGPQILGYRRMALTAKGLSLPDVPIHLYDDSRRNCRPVQGSTQTGAIGFANCFGVVPFEIGGDLLRQLRIYIASKERKIYFTRAGTPAAGDIAVAPDAAAPR